MSAVVRDSRPQDVGAIQAIYAHHVLDGVASFEEVPPAADEIANRRTEIVAQGFPYLVAEAQGEILGYAYVSRYRARAAYRYTVEDSVYVRPDFVGRGIGRMLLAKLVSRCEVLDLHRIVAVIGGSANTASVGLHAALGFEHAGVLREVGFKFGHWVDTVLMQRALRG